MMKDDYTRKTQELAELREEAKDALTLRDALKANPAATVKKLWESVSQGKPAVGNGQDNSPRGFPAQAAEADIDALVQRKLEEALANDPRIQELEAERSKQKINDIFATIEKEWGIDPISDGDKEAVLLAARESGTYDLEAVFAKLMHKRSSKLKDVENAEANSTVTGFGGSPAMGAPAAEAKTFESFRDAMNDTLSVEGVDKASLDRAISNL
jgi:hypothetical protein